MTTNHEVTFVVDHLFTDDELDALFDRVDDATPIRERGRTFVQFDRDADTLTDAVVTSLRDLEAAGLHASAVRSDDLVTPRQIATRTARSYESVRTLAAGTRGPGGFPHPCSPRAGPLQLGPGRTLVRPPLPPRRHRPRAAQHRPRPHHRRRRPPRPRPHGR